MNTKKPPLQSGAPIPGQNDERHRDRNRDGKNDSANVNIDKKQTSAGNEARK